MLRYTPKGATPKNPNKLDNISFKNVSIY